MGSDFKCGCRISGSWFLCDKHEHELMDKLEPLEDNGVDTT